MPNTTKKRMTGPQRKAQIVKVATELLIKRGFKGTTTREIARKAGISEAVIFKHFSRKEDLYKAIIDSRCNDSSGRSRLMGTLEGKKGKDVFKSVASFLIGEHRKDPSFLRLLLMSAIEKQNLSEVFIRTRGLELAEFLEGRIEELIRDGTLRKVDPGLTSRAFIGMVVHFSLAQEIYGLKRYADWPDDVVTATFVDIFFEGVRRR